IPALSSPCASPYQIFWVFTTPVNFYNNSDANGFDITQTHDTASCRFPTINREVVKFVFINPSPVQVQTPLYFLIVNCHSFDFSQQLF
ncbi:hypothetical protein, partial [Microcoleus sp. Pol11C3]|uniref:hypothetical protein n=1 Tax=Microcoleus sp. Pol11C3 TaxID=3055390 RepID=UPI002FD1EFB5